jgi:hypothetical protein
MVNKDTSEPYQFLNNSIEHVMYASSDKEGKVSLHACILAKSFMVYLRHEVSQTAQMTIQTFLQGR